MNGLESVFFNSLLKNRKERRGGGKKQKKKRELEETELVTFTKALKQLCSAVLVYRKLFVCGRQFLQFGLKPVKADETPLKDQTIHYCFSIH